jgi:enediyne biosynthesis thioesterase
MLEDPSAALTDCHTSDGRRAFCTSFLTTLEDTNALSNVYFVRHISWQGRCRELFLAALATEITDQLTKDLRLLTTRVECQYFSELHAFERVEVRMALAYMATHKIGLDFEYCVNRNEHVATVARGFQEIACMKYVDNAMRPTPVPAALVTALAAYK